jgi:uncharacterized Zn finger protein
MKPAKCPKCSGENFACQPMADAQRGTIPQGFQVVYLVKCDDCGAVVGAFAKPLPKPER